VKSYEKLLTQKQVNVDLYYRLGLKEDRNEAQQKQLEELGARMEYAPGTAVRAEMDNIINDHHANKAPQQKAIQEAKKRFATLKAELDDLDKGRKYRPVEHMFETLLNEYNIVYQQHFTMTLIGEHCHRWLVNNEEILDRLRDEVFIAGLNLVVEGVEPKSEERKAELTIEIDKLITDMKDLMSVLDFIVFTMREQRYHTDEECEIFENACKYLGHAWRECNLSPTCKIHSLETHVPWFMWRYRRLFGEDSIERLHANNNYYNRALRCIRSWSKRVVTREIRKKAGELTEVADTSKLVEDSTARAKRKLEPSETQTAKNLKRDEMKEKFRTTQDEGLEQQEEA